MEAEHLPDEPRWGSEHVNDLWEDMDTLNMLYEELCWGHDEVLNYGPSSGEIVVSDKNLNIIGSIKFNF